MRIRGSSSSEVWLFDAGEGSLSQLQRSCMRMSLVRNIFITHLHGDHLYGLPSLVLSVLRSRPPDPPPPPLDVYGPHGLRAFLRVALGVAGFRCAYRDVLRIHELFWPDAFGPKSLRSYCRPASAYWRTNVRKLPYEAPGRDLRPDTSVNSPRKYTYRLVSNSAGDVDSPPAIVVAAPVLHTVPTYAFTVEERVDRKRFDKKALAALGVATDGSARDLFRAWLGGSAAEIGDRQVDVEEVMKDGRNPRRVCIVGDTYNADGAAHIAKNADVLVHEATNAAAQSRVARARGHSSTSGAAAFAKKVEAKRLILNHTSVAYSERKIRAMETEARGMFGADRAFVARDLSLFSVPTCEEDDGRFVFRRFVGYADSSEYRGPREEDNPFRRELLVADDECAAASASIWDEEDSAVGTSGDCRDEEVEDNEDVGFGAECADGEGEEEDEEADDDTAGGGSESWSEEGDSDGRECEVEAVESHMREVGGDDREKARDGSVAGWL